ncbi:hypothetical protein CEH05_16560 [Halobacillus halophilus]|uniref:Amino acid transporter n=1 Tax=Halobacillus halophilus (strain ATCC 35676 / DSM 2266 / JCM 20832 / KCTC 3685 / LMG 17431 / NBRC 102448 / NCIMB 2269) TaxID=866895 RepID=I0JRC3_HALH3|nr:hypothetical protein [Halobacillus halophilus]ASF40677.1 hypothetical protein CEH05_16560 [Halobacillus halophilus]CCG46693.1 hypothetical protein HBHAL_4352 [Halobacillus halophilus DSM 2266]
MTDHKDYDEPFNDTADHQQNIEGYPKPSDGRLPLPIRLIGYFLFGGILLMVLAGLLGNVLFN